MSGNWCLFSLQQIINKMKHDKNLAITKGDINRWLNLSRDKRQSFNECDINEVLLSCKLYLKLILFILF